MLGGTESTSKKLSDQQRHIYRRRVLTFIVLFAVIVLHFLVLYNTKYSSVFLSSLSSPENEEVKLKRVLKEAAMKDNTVILTTLNEAWAAPNSIFDVFLESFGIGNDTEKLLKHLVIIAVDPKAYNRCLEIHPHCFRLTTEGVNFTAEASFMSDRYFKMMWTRTEFLRNVLHMGYSFVFTDADIMWLRDPFKRFLKEADFQISCDAYYGKSDDINNKPNGGFFYAKSNNRTKEFYNYWCSSKELFPSLNEQDVLDIIRHGRIFKTIGVKMRYLDTAYFGGLCSLPVPKLTEVCTMHVNCCFGLDNKLHDLKVLLQDWRKYLSLKPSFKGPSTSSIPQKCKQDDIKWKLN